MDEEVQEAWQNLEDHAAIKRSYAVLMRMTRQLLQNGVQKPPKRPGDALFEGAENFGSPEDPLAFPHFTSCRLTECGVSVALSRVLHHPDYRCLLCNIRYH